MPDLISLTSPTNHELKLSNLNPKIDNIYELLSIFIARHLYSLPRHLIMHSTKLSQSSLGIGPVGVRGVLLQVAM